ncbi:hypothetical protein TN53_40885 [Streptomyces sp. WM6386]|nr:hypothetical protein TN53_40885 [Streptomyces sp. WM6386]
MNDCGAGEIHMALGNTQILSEVAGAMHSWLQGPRVRELVPDLRPRADLQPAGTRSADLNSGTAHSSSGADIARPARHRRSVSRTAR